MFCEINKNVLFHTFSASQWEPVSQLVHTFLHKLFRFSPIMFHNGLRWYTTVPLHMTGKSGMRAYAGAARRLVYFATSTLRHLSGYRPGGPRPAMPVSFRWDSNLTQT